MVKQLLNQLHFSRHSSEDSCAFLMKWEMFLILAFTPGPLNSRRDTFKVYLKPILGMCFFWMCFLGCAPRYEIWSIEQKLWEYPFKPPSDTPRSR